MIPDVATKKQWKFTVAVIEGDCNVFICLARALFTYFTACLVSDYTNLTPG